ncbi:ABC transporter substrate-binding protein, partial [Pseudomonas aeruginosa]
IQTPLHQPQVRSVLDMAVSERAILDTVYQGAGKLAVNSMPPTQWTYDETIKDAPSDPAKAREMMKKAGVTEATEITLWAMPEQPSYNPNARLVAARIKADRAERRTKTRI